MLELRIYDKAFRSDPSQQTPRDKDNHGNPHPSPMNA
jgi:hypothetical protein